MITWVQLNTGIPLNQAMLISMKLGQMVLKLKQRVELLPTEVTLPSVLDIVSYAMMVEAPTLLEGRSTHITDVWVLLGVVLDVLLQVRQAPERLTTTLHTQ